MSIYYTGFYLNKVPTGFGFSTGLALINSGNSPVKYTIKISNTLLTGITSSDALGGDVPDKTIFISDDLINDSSNNNSIVKVVNPNDSGVVFVLHKPFSNYSLSPPNGKHTGHETARITVESVSSLGGVDDDIIIDISGQRIFVQPQPKRIGKFYAVTDYLPNSQVNIQYNWSIIQSENYLTGFRVETFSDSSFTTPVSIDTYEIKNNINESEPLFGKYDSFLDEDYTITLQNLSINQNYFARISGLNVDSSGLQTFVTGFTTYNPELDNTAFSGLTPSPGSNLKFAPQIFQISKISDSEVDFDLLKFLKDNNGGSLDFTKYSGAIIKFFPEKKPFAVYKADLPKNGSPVKGAINFVIPNDKAFLFSTDDTTIFKMQLEFENIKLYGLGGEAGSAVGDAKNGGPVFNLDNVINNSQKIQYYLYKDTDSVFYAGVAGGQALLVTDNTTSDTKNITIPGSRINYITDLDLRLINPNP